MNTRNRGGRTAPSRTLPKIGAPTRRITAIPSEDTRNGLSRMPKPAASPPKGGPALRRPMQTIVATRQAFKKAKPGNFNDFETNFNEEPMPMPRTVTKGGGQRRSLFDRLMGILSKERYSDYKMIDSDLKMVAMQDDPAEMAEMTKQQLDDLARSALEAETYQATLLAASVIEQMTEEQSKSFQPLMTDGFMRYLLHKLKEERDWRRLLDMDVKYLMATTMETDILMQAYAVILDRAFAAWLVRCRVHPITALDPDASSRDRDLYDGWLEMWSMFFHILDRYTGTLATRVGPEAFYTRGMTEDSRLRFLDDILHFITQLHDQTETDLQARALQCYDLYSQRLSEAVTACVKADYEGESDGATAEAHFDEILTALTSRCLQCGPKLLRIQPFEGKLVDPKAVSLDNIAWRVEAAIMKGLFNAYETVKDYQQHPMDPVVKPNIGDMMEKVLFQISHSCVGDSLCSCYARSADQGLIESCELFICDTVADRYAVDFAPHIDSFVSHYRGVPNDRWMRALLTVYPSAKKEVTKYFTMFADMENDSQQRDTHHDWRPIALSLMVKVSSDNAKLFDSKLVKSIEAVFFSKKAVLSIRALYVLRNVAANNPRAMLGCGKYYYTAAAELPDMEIAPMNIANEILRNIGLQSEEEAERVIAIMEQQIRHSQDKSFIEDVLKQWHYLAIVYHEPIEARRALIDEYRQDPLLCKAAYEVFSLATGQQTKATACSVM